MCNSTCKYGNNNNALAICTCYNYCSLHNDYRKYCTFQPERNHTESYLDRVQLYVTAYNFPEERNVAALFSIKGGSVDVAACTLLTPNLPQTKSYQMLKTTLYRANIHLDCLSSRSVFTHIVATEGIESPLQGITNSVA